MVMLNYIFSFGTMAAITFLIPSLLAGFCGPIKHPLTTFCRRLFLRTYGSKMKQLWYDWLPIYAFFIFGLVCQLVLFWRVAALYSMLLCFTWIFRLWLLTKFPQRGYLPAGTFHDRA